MGPNETSKLLHSKAVQDKKTSKQDKQDKQDKKITLRMGENICKWSNWQRINLQNLQAAHAAQCQKNNQPNPKMGRRP